MSLENEIYKYRKILYDLHWKWEVENVYTCDNFVTNLLATHATAWMPCASLIARRGHVFIDIKKKKIS